jgi:hypothetical protein
MADLVMRRGWQSPSSGAENQGESAGDGIMMNDKNAG